MWNVIVEKALNVEVNANLQLFSRTRKINFKCLKRYKPSVKKDKDDAYQEHRKEASNKDKEKAKSYNSFSAKQVRLFEIICYGIFEYLLAAGSKAKVLLGLIITYFGTMKTNAQRLLHLQYLI